MGDFSSKPLIWAHACHSTVQQAGLSLAVQCTIPMKCSVVFTHVSPSQALRHMYGADHQQGHISRDQPPSLCKLH